MNDKINMMKLAKDLRDPGNVSELVESMKQFGWNEEFPAIADEDGVVLVGNRRMKAAKQAKVAPVIKTIKLGTGEKADVERVKLALISNLGHKPMTTEDRKRIAEHLYGNKQWTMERIAEVLNVSHQTIGRDLDSLSIVDKPARPKGGRPKGSKKPRKVRPKQTDNQQDKIIALADAGMTSPEIATELGVEGRAVRHAIERENIRRNAEARIDPSALSLSAQRKFETAIRQSKRKLDIEFEQRVLEEIKQRMEDLVLPSYNERKREYDRIINARKGIMNRATFKLIWTCLHPDSRNSVSDKKLAEAFDAFSKLELLLLNEQEYPTMSAPLPKTFADLMALKANRRARKQNGKQSIRLI